MTTSRLPDHSDLPLPDYDHLPLPALQHRIRTLDEAALVQVVAYEEAHAARPLALLSMQHRLDDLRSGAQPSGGDPASPAVEAAPPPSGGSKVSGATTGPVANPTSQGDPTNPGQPRGSGKGGTQSSPYGT